MLCLALNIFQIFWWMLESIRSFYEFVDQSETYLDFFSSAIAEYWKQSFAKTICNENDSWWPSKLITFFYILPKSFICITKLLVTTDIKTQFNWWHMMSVMIAVELTTQDLFDLIRMEKSTSYKGYTSKKSQKNKKLLWSLSPLFNKVRILLH